MVGAIILAAAAWWAAVSLIKKIYQHDVKGRDE
jgi:hypothetical protein